MEEREGGEERGGMKEREGGENNVVALFSSTVVNHACISPGSHTQGILFGWIIMWSTQLPFNAHWTGSWVCEVLLYTTLYSVTHDMLRCHRIPDRWSIRRCLTPPIF